MQNLELVDRFFAEARSILAGDLKAFSILPHDLLEIAEQSAMRSEFDRRLLGLNDPDLKRLIEDFIRDASEAMNDAALDDDRKVDLLDRAGLSVAGSVTVGGIGLAIAKGAAGGSVLGPMGMFGGGLIGLIFVAWGRDTLKRRSNRSMSWRRKLRRLIGKD